MLHFNKIFLKLKMLYPFNVFSLKYTRNPKIFPGVSISSLTCCILLTLPVVSFPNPKLKGLDQIIRKEPHSGPRHPQESYTTHITGCSIHTEKGNKKSTASTLS